MEPNPLKQEEIFNEEEKKIVNFQPKLITGGKDGTEGPWLLQQPQGAMVVVMNLKDHRDFGLPVFTILHKTEKSVRLVNPAKKIDERVDPIRFCQQYGYVETLCIVDVDSLFITEKEEEND